MGLKQSTSAGKYIKLKDGKFMLSKDESGAQYDELEGKLVDIYLKDESFNGQDYRKVYLVMNDGTDNLIIGFRLDSRYASSFLRFVKNVNLNEPFTLHAVGNKAKDKDGKDITVYGLIVSQPYGNFIKAFYTKEHPNGLPAMEQKIVNKKKVWDKGDLLEFYEELIEKEIKPKLPGRSTTVIKQEEEQFETPDENENYPWDK